MRKQTRLSILAIGSILLYGFTNFYFREVQEPLDLETKGIVNFKIKLPSFELNETDLFLDAIGHYESSNRYHITNRFGYMGKYQFGKATLRGLGYEVSRKEFLNSPEIQEQAMLDLLSHNKKILQKYIDYWDGKKINGKVITESGILAAAHLAGPGNVKRFLKEGKNFKDGNGTKLTTYLIHFSGYNLNLE